MRRLPGCQAGAPWAWPARQPPPLLFRSGAPQQDGAPASLPPPRPQGTTTPLTVGGAWVVRVGRAAVRGDVVGQRLVWFRQLCPPAGGAAWVGSEKGAGGRPLARLESRVEGQRAAGSGPCWGFWLTPPVLARAGAVLPTRFCCTHASSEHDRRRVSVPGCPALRKLNAMPAQGGRR